jgi:RNA polymerase sigma factor (TIGR02999 family)
MNRFPAAKVTFISKEVPNAMQERTSVDYDNNIRRLLTAIRKGGREAFEPLIEAVGHELRKISAFRLRQYGYAHTLQTTALVHEVVIRLMKMIDRPDSQFPESREHFLALASHMMRCTLADHARKRRLVTTSLDTSDDRIAVEHSAAAAQMPLIGWTVGEIDALLTVDKVLVDMEQTGEVGARRGKVMELYVFGGLNYREIGTQLGITDDMARRDCQIGLAQVRGAFTGS